MSTSASSEHATTTAGPADGPLAEVPAHLVRRVHQRHGRLWAEVVGDEPTPPQYAVLVVVAAAPGIDLTTLGEQAALDRTTVGRVVDRLVRAGWLVRAPDPTDARRALVHLTDEGATRLPDVTARASEASQRLLASLVAPETEELLGLLQRVAHEP